MTKTLVFVCFRKHVWADFMFHGEMGWTNKAGLDAQN